MEVLRTCAKDLKDVLSFKYQAENEDKTNLHCTDFCSMLCAGYTCTVHFFIIFFFCSFFCSSLTLDWDSMKQVQLFTQETEAYGRVTQGHTIYIQDFCLWESMIKWLLQIKGISLISSSFLTMTPCVGVILGRTSQVFVLPGGETKHSHS